MRGVLLRRWFQKFASLSRSHWLATGCLLGALQAPIWAADPVARPMAAPARISDPAATLAEPPADQLDANDLAAPSKAARPLPTETDLDSKPSNRPCETLTFQGLQPGVSTAVDVSAWGEPKFKRAKPGGQTLVYELPQFKRVEISLEGTQVESIVAHLERPQPIAAVTRQFQISASRPVPVTDDNGAIIGEAYPECGVVLSFAPGVKPTVVAHVLIERIDPVPFVLRAERDVYNRPQSAYADLETALSLDAELDRALWLKAELLMSIGRYHDALRAAEAAVHLDKSNAEYKLTLGKALILKSRYAEAIQLLEELTANEQNPAPLRAYAWLQLGKAHGHGQPADFKQALAAHMEAVKAAAPAARSASVGARRNAKQTLVDAYLGAARDIGYGGWQKKEVVVPQWLDKAGQQVEDIIKQEAGDEELRLLFFQESLAACLGAPTQFDIDEMVKKLSLIAESLLKQSDDPWRRERLEWLIGVGYADAAQISQVRGKHPQTENYADKALTFLERGSRNRQLSREEEYTLGKLYYRVGARKAIQGRDHAAAMKWYDKALPLLERTLAETAAHEWSHHGELLVSIGVSYWETGKREEAVQITMSGADFMQHAVDNGRLGAPAMSVPYSNLASMHKALGEEMQSREFAELAAKTSTVSGPPPAPQANSGYRPAATPPRR